MATLRQFFNQPKHSETSKLPVVVPPIKVTISLSLNSISQISDKIDIANRIKAKLPKPTTNKKIAVIARELDKTIPILPPMQHPKHIKSEFFWLELLA
jgi:hypothetical protein